MNNAEWLNYAEMKLDEAIRFGASKDRDYWRGYIAAVSKLVEAEEVLRSPDSSLYREIIVSMAKHTMNLSAVSKDLHYHRRTIEYHCGQIHRKFGFNPRKFYDLCQLVKMVKEGAI